jgi:hypothetical protein
MNYFSPASAPTLNYWGYNKKPHAPGVTLRLFSLEVRKMIHDIPKPEISADFTIDDIHKIRDWHY